MSKEPWVAGVDGCRTGWVVARRPLSSAEPCLLSIAGRFEDILALAPSPVVIGIDMPIGLPDRSLPGQRPDTAARTVLGARQSSIFSVPSRAAVYTEGYAEACDVASATSEPPRKVSKQAFHLFPKIREIDALMTPELQGQVYEVHPEVAFWAMNREQPLDLPKKVKSQPYPAGLALRLDLLKAQGYPADLLNSASRQLGRAAGLDDILDAAAVSWTAARIARGEARRFPADPTIDGRGLRMEIWG